METPAFDEAIDELLGWDTAVQGSESKVQSSTARTQNLDPLNQNPGTQNRTLNPEP